MKASISLITVFESSSLPPAAASPSPSAAAGSPHPYPVMVPPASRVSKSFSRSGLFAG